MKIQPKLDPPYWPGAGPPVERLRFRRAPLLAAAVAFSGGDLLAHPAQAYRPPVLLLAFAILLIALALGALGRLGGKRPGGAAALLPALVLWVVVGFWSAEIPPAPPSQTALVRYADGLSRTVRGRITRIRELPPRASALDRDADLSEWEETEAPPVLSFDLAVEGVEELTPETSRLAPVAGGVRVALTGDAPAAALHCGDILEAPLRLRTPERYRDPGAWQYADYLAAQGIGTHATLAAARVSVLSAAGKADARCRLYAAQTWAADRLLAYTSSRANRLLPPPLRLTADDAGMLNAMLFGDRDRLNHTLRLGFERTGSFHLFVVSGMHVGLLAGGLFWMARRLRLPEGAATLVTIPATALYALLTGFGAPVQRALLMSAIFLIARLLSRERNVLNGLGAAALGVLVLSPPALFESGFQMTFLAIVAIAGIAIPLGEWSFLPYARACRKLDDLWLDTAMHPRLAQFRILLRIWGEHLEPLLAPAFGIKARHLPAVVVRWTLWAAELLLIGVVAEAIMLLPMAVYFHRATLFALPANAFSIPLVAVLAPLALLTFLLSLISAWLAAVPAAATALILHAITGVIARIGGTHLADWRVPGPSPLVIAIAICGWAGCCWLVRRSRPQALIAAAALPLIAAMILWPEPAVRTPDALEVTAIDVGQGDSLLVVGPGGRTMLIDAGGPVGRPGSTGGSIATDSFDLGEDVVSPYLWSRRIRRLDVVALTHAHSDHMGGMPAVLRNFRPRELWVGVDPGSSAYAALLKEAASLSIAVRHLHAGDATDLDELHITTLAPAPSYENHGPPANNDSLVLRVDFGDASALLEGDAEAPSERAMLAAGEVRPVTLLKIGHHGSRTSTTPEFFAAASPRLAVISVGRGNTFGHPRAEVLARIAAARVPLYRTDRFGLAQFLLTKDGSIQEIGGDGSVSLQAPAPSLHSTASPTGKESALLRSTASPTGKESALLHSTASQSGKDSALLKGTASAVP
jgi:competence protein ComEC